jgi:hypothetical protein
MHTIFRKLKIPKKYQIETQKKHPTKQRHDLSPKMAAS